MPSRYRPIIGAFKLGDGTPAANATVVFQLSRNDFTLTDVFEKEPAISVVLDENGYIPQTDEDNLSDPFLLWCNGDGYTRSRWIVLDSDGTKWKFIHHYGDGSPIHVSALRAGGSLLPDEPTIISTIERIATDFIGTTTGQSAYQIATSQGFVGTINEWLLSLKGATGAQGPVGATGATGAQGIQGIQGPTGATGAQGPVGATGAQGIQGIPGVDGIDGQNGADGADGADGDDGISAYQVALNEGFVGTPEEWLESLIGPQGIQGPQGVKGDDGDIGPQGPQGTQGTQGIQGIPGADGADGTNGTDGVDGLDGDSAYEVAVFEGFIGTEAEWLLSLVGPQGAQGPQGIQGFPGDDVADGAQGIQGIQGPQGIQGIQGPAGNNGADGIDGADGVDGDSAYEIAVNNGFVGTEEEWLESLHGEDGTGAVDSVNGHVGPVVLTPDDLDDTTSTNKFVDASQIATWNAKQPALGFTPENSANKSVDGTFSANSDALFPSEKATKTYIATQIAALVNGAPALLDTLNEFSAAIGNDENFAATVATNIGLRAPKLDPVFEGVAKFQDGSAAAPAIAGANYNNTGFYFESLPIAASTRFGVSVDGETHVFFHSKVDSNSSIPAGTDATGFLRVEGQFPDTGRAKVGLAVKIETIGVNQTSNGSQTAFSSHLSGNAFIGAYPTYAGYFENSSKTSKAAFGVLAFVDGNTVAESGSGTSPGTSVGGGFYAKDGLVGAIGIVGDATTDDNPVPYNVGVIGLAKSGTTASAAGYFGLHALNISDGSEMPTIPQTAALIANNSTQTADIFRAEDNGTAVFTIADGGAITFAGSGFLGLTKAMVGLTDVQNYGIATQEEAQAGTVSNKYMTPERTAEAIAALAVGGGGIGSLVEDTTPQLGGNLNLDTFTVGAATAADLIKLNAVTASAAQLNYVGGVTSAIQTQIDLLATKASPQFSGNVGIGAAGLNPLYIYGATNGTTIVVLERNSSSANGFQLNFIKNRNVGVTPNATVAAESLGKIRFQGSDGVATVTSSFPVGAAIEAIVEALATSNLVQTSLVFTTISSGHAAMTLKHDRTAVFGGAVQMIEVVGTNVAGLPFNIGGGRGTGNAAAGDVVFSVSAVGSSGSTVQTLAEVGRFTRAGLSVTGSVSLAAPIVNTVPFTISGYSLTGANTQSLFDMSGTWNTSGTPTAIKLNIVDTASNASSRFVDLQRAGVSQFLVDKNGNITTLGLVAGAHLRALGAGYIEWTSRGRMYSPADGIVRLADQAGTGFSRLQFGGTTNAFPSLKRNNAELHARLADDSGFANFFAANLVLSGHIQMQEISAPAAPAANNGLIYLDDSAGKTRMVALFPSGAVQQIAIEP
jgi:hypothetical protein